MEIKLYEKPVITKFVEIDGEEFLLSEMYGALTQMLETRENDCYGEYSFRNYELDSYEATQKLVKMGLVKNYTGSRMADLYCIKDKKGIEELLEELENMMFRGEK